MAPKKKDQKMSIGEFLGDQSLGSWADEMEDVPVASSRTGYGGDRGGSFGGWGGDRGDRGGYDREPRFQREQLPLPTKPPFTAHLGNLSFDATEGDIQDFFGDCEVSSVRIVEDKIERKPKGFGYVEFATLDGLKKALDLAGTQFQGRNIKISVADPPKDRPDARELNDWTRKGPLPDLPQNQRRPSERGGFNRFDDNASNAGSERGAAFERGGSRRGGPPFEGDGKPRDFGNWERKGPLSPVPGPGPRDNAKVRGGQELPVRERKLSPAWGEGTGRGQEGAPRGPRREFQERPPPVERAPTASELDNQWRSKMRPDAPVKSPDATPDVSTPSSPAAAPAAPAGRPRLNLQKRTVSEVEPALSSAASTDAKASPFGAARPIDTATREKEIEEKRELVAQQKKEAEEKVREEKRVRDAAAKAEKEKAADAGETEEKQENGPGKSFEILQRTEEGDNEEENTVEEENANGEIVEDKAVKPKEIVRNAPPRRPSAQQGQGSWRKQPPKKDAPAPESTTEQMDADGWSTVGSNPRRGGNRRGGGPSRAIAS